MSYVHVCPKCKGVFKYPSTDIRECPDCKFALISTNISDAQWATLSPAEKNDLKQKKLAEGQKQQEDEQRRKQENKRIEEEKNRLKEERRKEAIKKKASIIVTTGDLKRNYEVLGPVFFQVSNKGILGSALGTLKNQYYYEIQAMKQNGTMSESRPDWGFLYGEWSVGQSDFEAAFFIATEELKTRAAMVGADAVICMRQDIDLDTNGFAFFYLQMYGTAVKFID